VWPLGTGIQALAFYRYHRPHDAENLVRALVQQSFLNSLGHVPEVFSGNLYRELDISVPEQIWSSGIVITSLMRGTLGLDPDVPASELHWTPHLPSSWTGVTIKNLVIGKTVVALEMSQSKAGIKVTVEENGPPVSIAFAPEIPQRVQQIRATLNGQAIQASIRRFKEDSHAEIKFNGGKQIELVLTYEGDTKR
jgi:hypothetical protein